MEWIPALLALSAMEIVLGIDNVVFIAILAGRLPEAERARARAVGLGIALVARLALLFTIKLILGLTEPIFALTDLGVPAAWLTWPGADGKPHLHEEINGISWRDIVLLAGGLFLIAKSVHEIHVKIEGNDHHREAKATATFFGVVAQIGLMDLVFSLDSVITAIGMVPPDQLWVMVVAILIAMGVMLAFAGAVGRFVEQHPTLKILALSFLILIGVMLVAEGVGSHFDKGYVYFAMAFSLVVEFLNLKVRARKRADRAAGEAASATE